MQLTYSCIADSSLHIPVSRLRLLDDAVAMEQDNIKIGFVARALIQATLPYRDPKSTHFQRQNGNFVLTIMAPPNIGLPYGIVPRLVLCWITTEAIQKKEKTLLLGDMSKFMRALDLSPSGGHEGTITRLKDQMHRLFSSTLNITYIDDNVAFRAGRNISVAHRYSLWFHDKAPGQVGLWPSSVTLSDDFFREIVEHPVPIDLRALKALKRRTRSPMAIDVYCWLVHRLSYLKRPVVIPWASLKAQFGADYSRIRDFRAGFLEALENAQIVYPAARAELADNGLRLRPSKVHVPRCG